ncbi:MAG: L,D-transpeptidase family protein [Mycobacteriales bacterium]
MKRSAASRLGFVLGAALGATLAVSATPAAAAETTQVQMITVRAHPAATTASLEAIQRPASGGLWKLMHPAIYAYVGAQGIGPASEYLSRTPAGTFSLSEAYGRLANPGTTLPYKVLDWFDWWVSDVNSGYYNTHYRCGGTVYCPFNVSKGERLMSYGALYDYLVVINYNRWPVVKGAGSAFFLHVSNGRPTAGCVAVSRADMIWLLRWLKKEYKPLIKIYVT